MSQNGYPSRYSLEKRSFILGRFSASNPNYTISRSVSNWTIAQIFKSHDLTLCATIVGNPLKCLSGQVSLPISKNASYDLRASHLSRQVALQMLIPLITRY